MEGHGPLYMLLAVPGQGTKTNHCFSFEIIGGDEVVVEHGEHEDTVIDLVLRDYTENY